MHVLARVAVPLVAASLLGACAVAPRSQGGWSGTSPESSWPAQGGSASTAVSFGTVTGIELARDGSRAAPTGSGAVIGGIVGAVAGRAMAGSTTDGYRQRNIATALGAAVGAFMGHQAERHNLGSSAGVRVTVALDRGGNVTLDQRDIGDLRVGDRVRIEGDRVMRAG
jgi:outer membrane lipoprotein SlyB